MEEGIKDPEDQSRGGKKRELIMLYEGKGGEKGEESMKEKAR